MDTSLIYWHPLSPSSSRHFQYNCYKKDIYFHAHIKINNIMGPVKNCRTKKILSLLHYKQNFNVFNKHVQSINIKFARILLLVRGRFVKVLKNSMLSIKVCTWKSSPYLDAKPDTPPPGTPGWHFWSNLQKNRDWQLLGVKIWSNIQKKFIF